MIKYVYWFRQSSFTLCLKVFKSFVFTGFKYIVPQRICSRWRSKFKDFIHINRQLLLTNLNIIAFMHWSTLSLVEDQFINWNSVEIYDAFYLVYGKTVCIILLHNFVFSFLYFRYDPGTTLGTRGKIVAE